jgi:polysaccharide export outer membrane protein
MTRIGVSLLIIGAALTTGACAGGAASTLPVGAAAYEAVPEAVPADRSSGTIRVGDRLDVRVFGEPELSGDSFVVDPSGIVNFPLVGEIIAMQQTPRQLADELERRLGARFVRNPHVTVAVAASPLASYTVEGDVGAPGNFPVTASTTLLTAMAEAKSPTKLARREEIIVLRKINGQQAGARFNLDQIRAGRAADPQILAGDKIVVTTSGPKSAWADLLGALPLLNLFLYINKN